MRPKGNSKIFCWCSKPCSAFLLVSCFFLSFSLLFVASSPGATFPLSSSLSSSFADLPGFPSTVSVLRQIFAHIIRQTALDPLLFMHDGILSLY